MVLEITSNGTVLGLIIRGSCRQGYGTRFFTPGDCSQQVASINRHSGEVIDAHIHNPVSRHITKTGEVFIVSKGKWRVDFYDDDRSYVESRILNKGDIYLLINGGHAFKALVDAEMIEVKQGPHVDGVDKTSFSGMPSDQINIKE